MSSQMIFICRHCRKLSYSRWLLALLSATNFANLLYWVYWAWMVSNDQRRRQYVLDHWMKLDNTPAGTAAAFAATLPMSNLLLFDFIAVHSGPVVAVTVCMALFKHWRNEPRPSCGSNARVGLDIPMHSMEI